MEITLIICYVKMFFFIYEYKILEKNCNTFISGMQILNIPLLVTEQYSKGLGPTIESVRNTLGGFKPIEKMSFSCCGESSFLPALEKLNKLVEFTNKK